MNSLAQLPAAPSAAFSLNLMDWRKLLRMALVLVASGFVTTGAPWLLHFSYVIHGVDFTPVIIPAVAMLVEAARRFVAGASK